MTLTILAGTPAFTVATDPSDRQIDLVGVSIVIDDKEFLAAGLEELDRLYLRPAVVALQAGLRQKWADLVEEIVHDATVRGLKKL